MYNLTHPHSNLLRFLLISLFSISSHCAHSQPGTLDTSYGDNGTVVENLGNYPEAYCSDLDAQGRLVVGGRIYVYENGLRYAFLARFLPDGSLDPTFGNGGYVIDSTVDGWIFGLTIASDGKILACGRVLTTTAEYSYDYIVFRYNENGTIDTNFGNDGKTLVDFGGLHRNVASDIHEQADGKILINGDFQYGSQGLSNLDKIGVCRLMPDGNLDTLFGTNGLVIEDLSSVSANCYFSKLDANDKLVVAGWRDLSDNRQGVLSRYNTDGTLDTTFGTNGLAFVNVLLTDYVYFSIVIADDGNIFTCGTSTVPETNEWDFIVAKFNSSGIVDTSFADNGFLHLELPNVHKDEAHDLVLQQDGKLLVIGQVNNNADNDRYEFATLRLNQNGTVDSTFGENGLSLIAVGAGDAYPVTVERLSDDKVLLVGFSDDNTTDGIVIARILTSENLGVVDLDSGQTQLLVYPNPVRESATLQYELNREANVSVELFNIEGKYIKEVMPNTKLYSGKHQIEINLSDLAGGTYLLKLTTNNNVTTLKLIKP